VTTAFPDPHYLQRGYSYRFEWGEAGLRSVAGEADVVVIVDILRFTSAVSAAIEGGSVVLPYPWRHDDLPAYAAQHDAVAAGLREEGPLSLSPTDLLTMPGGTRLVLPSPNGGLLSFMARDFGATKVLAGCFRNAAATARYARACAGDDGVIAVIASGERWEAGPETLRAAVEDLLGAGAILAALDPSAAVAKPRCSPEAAAARVAFLQARPRLYEAIASCGSGRKLIDRGWADDVAASAALDVTDVVAELVGDEFVAVKAV
jgi:2-phosphosulfolactate phosphatase